jgi:hypothetical protein
MRVGGAIKFPQTNKTTESMLAFKMIGKTKFVFMHRRGTAARSARIAIDAGMVLVVLLAGLFCNRYCNGRRAGHPYILIGLLL